MRKALRIAALAGLVLLGYWIYEKWFPSDEKLIRALFIELADTASFASSEAPLTRLAKANQVSELFSSDVVVNLEGVSVDFDSVQGRVQLRDLVLTARSNLNQLRIEFLDVQVELDPDRESAAVHLTAVADINGEKRASIQELKFSLQKIAGDWFITRVDTIKTLGR